MDTWTGVGVIPITMPPDERTDFFYLDGIIDSNQKKMHLRIWVTVPSFPALMIWSDMHRLIRLNIRYSSGGCMWDSVTIRDWQSSIWDLNNKLNVMAGGKGPVVDAGDFTHEVEWDTIPASFPLSINPPVAKQTWVLKIQGSGAAKVSLCRQTPMIQ